MIGAILLCPHCGAGQLPDELVAHSAAQYINAEDADYLVQADERIRNAHALLDFLGDKRGRLLEVGSACGFLLAAARERGFDVEGLEPSRWAAEHARRRYNLRIHCGHIEDAPLSPESYDVVVMADTIEHLRNPRAAIDRVRTALRKDGVILILTPDLGSFVARTSGRFWWGLLDDHCVYFTRGSLAMMLNQHGFNVERIAAFGRAFSLGHWASKLLQYNQRIGALAVRLTRFTGLAGRSLRLNLGDQMVCVARKR